jgi:hypothetical protein
MEPRTKTEQDDVLKIFSRHYNSHPFIPDRHGKFRSAEEIHRACSSEMYHWCREQNYFRLWAYLWVNWYQPKEWKLWARSVNEKEIPVLKTTMIVESHWRKIKHDYLHDYSRPRIDLVIWVLLDRLIPSAMTRMQFSLNAIVDKKWHHGGEPSKANGNKRMNGQPNQVVLSTITLILCNGHVHVLRS